jgi:hypothetical protein
MSGTYVVTNQSLPRSLDVQISLSKLQVESRTNLSVLCVVGSSLGLLPDANRIRYYMTEAEVAQDFSSGANVYQAAQAFFSQSPRPTQMAIAEAFFTAQPAFLAGGLLTTAQIASLSGVSSGGLNVAYNPGPGVVTQDFTGVNLTGVTTLSQIAAALQDHAGTGLSVNVMTLAGGTQYIAISTVANGDGVTIAAPTSPSGGTDLTTMLNMTVNTGLNIYQGYTPTGIAGELDNIAAAANSNKTFVYVWALSAELRTPSTYQEPAAAWAAAQPAAILGLVTNDVGAYNPSDTSDLASAIGALSNQRAFCLYHDQVSQYPEISILAYMLSVNYQLQDSTVTAKFKQLPGCSTVQLTATQWEVLQGKGYNTYTAVGNSSMTYREGTTENTSYFLDDIINLDNFIEDLSVGIYNVFLMNKKVPYTFKGQMMLVDAAINVGNQYIYNGTFADRLIQDSSVKSGVSTVPGVQVLPAPIQNMSAAQRSTRIGPPINIIGQLAGAIHSVAIAVEVVS